MITIAKRTPLGFVEPDEQARTPIGQPVTVGFFQGDLPGGFPGKGSANGGAYQRETKRPDGGAGTNGAYQASCRNR